MDATEMINKMVDNVVFDNSAEAQKDFNDIVQMKLTAALDAKKQDLASTVFNKKD